MPEVLVGSMPGLTVAKATVTMADLLGISTNNNRFKNAVKGWLNDTLQDIQLHDPKMRRTIVHDAPWTTIPGVAVYDVRATVENGGFGWDNCFEVVALVSPDVSTRPLEPLSLAQYRQRSYIMSDAGPSYGWVLLDQFRVRVVPIPDQAYSGTGDYYQDIPEITDPAAKVDWPRAWDAVLMQGLKYRGLEWLYTNQPGLWAKAYAIYQDRIAKLKLAERTTARRPGAAVSVRALRSRRRIPHDNSTDSRYRYW